MLHQVNEPGCISQLERIVDFQREVFAAACNGNYQLQLQESDIKTLFGNDKGEWFWQKLYKQNQDKSNLHIAMENLITHYQQNPQEGIDALNAFDNDIQFNNHLNDPSFRFQFLTLSQSNQNRIKPFMVAFYEDLLSSSGGFPETIQGSIQKLNRDNFIESFWQNNPMLEVCPACDREKSDKVDNKIYDDADHFLPKAKYPFLSVHPYNLFPVCIYCNRSFKGKKDMVNDHNDAPLPNIFHPYLKPAITSLNLKITRDQQGVSTIEEFTDTSSMPSRRMASLNRVFRLNERWGDKLEAQKRNIIDNIIDERANLRRRKHFHLLNDSELRELLDGAKNDAVRRWGKKPGLIIQHGYLKLALSDQDEFDTLLDYFR